VFVKPRRDFVEALARLEGFWLQVVHLPGE
jgi:hypothetical protein